MSEERLRERLTALTADLVAADLATPAAQLARRRTRRRLAGVGAVTVAVVGLASVVALRPDLPIDDTTVPDSLPAAAAAGIPDSAFDVAAPVLAVPAGPGPGLKQPPCTPRDVTARAELRRTADGAVGVVELRGAGCSLVTDGPGALLDRAGQVVASAVDPQPGINPAQYARSDIPLMAGAASWGWSWSGSWCGSPAEAVVVQLRTDGDLATDGQDLVVPLFGPAPACRGESDATMVRGVPGRLGDPVLSGPESWVGLRLSLAMAAPEAPDPRIGLLLTVSNPTGVDVDLEPCAHYALLVETGDLSGRRGTSGGPGGALPCGARISAGGSVMFALSTGRFELDPVVPAVTTSRTVSVAIAGVPTASVQVP